MLEHMRKSNPKVFYKYFKKKQPKQTMITNDAFFEHFKGLANSKEVIQEDLMLTIQHLRNLTRKLQRMKYVTL